MMSLSYNTLLSLGLGTQLFFTEIVYLDGHRRGSVSHSLTAVIGTGISFSLINHSNISWIGPKLNFTQKTVLC